MESNFRRNLIISSSISIVILIVSSTASFLSINSLLKSNQLVNHTQQIIYNLNNSQRIVLEAQTGVRGFLVTGNDDFLQRYLQSKIELAEVVKELEVLTTNNNKQQIYLRALKSEHQKLYNYLREKVFLKRQGLAIGIADLNQGKKIMDDLRNLYSKMENEELVLLKTRTDKSADYGIYSSILILFAALIAITLSALFFVRILNDFKKRAELTTKLEVNEQEMNRRIAMVSIAAQKITRGDYSIKVENHEGDLGSIGISLNQMSESLQENFDKLASREWIKTGIAELNGFK